MFLFCRGPKPTVLNNSITSKSYSQNPVWTNDGDLAQPVLPAKLSDSLKKTQIIQIQMKQQQKPKNPNQPYTKTKTKMKKPFLIIETFHFDILNFILKENITFSIKGQKSVFTSPRCHWICPNICWIKLLAAWADSCLLRQAGRLCVDSSLSVSGSKWWCAHNAGKMIWYSSVSHI